MKTKILEQAKRWWKQIVAILLIAFIVAAPRSFIVYNLDIGFLLIKIVGALFIARVAKSTLDTWQSHHDKTKSVSVSRFMAETKNDTAKAVIHAVQIFSIAIIIMAALLRG
tara:strand:+ start:893 stop:1225 length:333 start_codon:yes stop_codon:yes gene_type:complete